MTDLISRVKSREEYLKAGTVEMRSFERWEFYTRCASKNDKNERL